MMVAEPYLQMQYGGFASRSGVDVEREIESARDFSLLLQDVSLTLFEIIYVVIEFLYHCNIIYNRFLF